jgi:mRNA-degrading endonuclease RelE of RelBE toxin-antitoxin system
MACYSIQWKKSAVKELQKLARQVILGIVEAVNALAVDPLPIGSKKIREAHCKPIESVRATTGLSIPSSMTGWLFKL